MGSRSSGKNKWTYMIENKTLVSQAQAQYRVAKASAKLKVKK